MNLGIMKPIGSSISAIAFANLHQKPTLNNIQMNRSILFFRNIPADFDPGKSTRWLNIIRAKKNGMMKW